MLRVSGLQQLQYLVSHNYNCRTMLQLGMLQWEMAGVEIGTQ